MPVGKVIAALAIAGAAGALVASTARARQANVNVVVNARCNGRNTTEITVRPWNVRIRQGDQLSWVLAGNANTSEITITQKDGGDWPFEAGPPYRGTKNTPARATRMRSNAQGTYKYNIQLICQSGSNQPDTVVVDPDVIVDALSDGQG